MIICRLVRSSCFRSRASPSCSVTRQNIWRHIVAHLPLWRTLLHNDTSNSQIAHKITLWVLYLSSLFLKRSNSPNTRWMDFNYKAPVVKAGWVAHRFGLKRYWVCFCLKSAPIDNSNKDTAVTLHRSNDVATCW